MGQVIQGPWGDGGKTIREVKVSFEGEYVRATIGGQWIANLLQVEGDMFILESYEAKRLTALGMVLKLLEGPSLWSSSALAARTLRLVGYQVSYKAPNGMDKWDRVNSQPWPTITQELARGL